MMRKWEQIRTAQSNVMGSLFNTNQFVILHYTITRLPASTSPRIQAPDTFPRERARSGHGTRLHSSQNSNLLPIWATGIFKNDLLCNFLWASTRILQNSSKIIPLCILIVLFKTPYCRNLFACAHRRIKYPTIYKVCVTPAFNRSPRHETVTHIWWN